MPIRGVVRPLHQAAIATDLAIRVRRILVREAQSFKAGDVLVEFDCERMKAEHAAAEAQHREMTLALKSNTYLDRKGAIGRFDVEISRVRAQKSKAEAQALHARLKQCRLVAPFDGRVTQLSVNAHEFANAGNPTSAWWRQRHSKST